jgi:hypothetical protein
MNSLSELRMIQPGMALPIVEPPIWSKPTRMVLVECMWTPLFLFSGKVARHDSCPVPGLFVFGTSSFRLRPFFIIVSLLNSLAAFATFGERRKYWDGLASSDLGKRNKAVQSAVRWMIEM